MSSAWSITHAAHAPRAAFVNFPLGHTVGRPHEPAEQLAIMRDALGAFSSIEESGEIVPLRHSWPTPWREAARELSDSRSERHDTPQYQSSADESAAVEAHGHEVACAVCVPADVPIH